MIHPAAMVERLPLFSPGFNWLDGKLIKVFIDSSGSFRYAAYILIPFVQIGNQMHELFFLLHTETID